MGEWQAKQKHQQTHICDNRGCKQEKYNDNEKDRKISNK